VTPPHVALDCGNESYERSVPSLSDVIVALFPFSTDMQDARMGAVRPFYRLGFSSSLTELGVGPAAALPVV